MRRVDLRVLIGQHGRARFLLAIRHRNATFNMFCKRKSHTALFPVSVYLDGWNKPFYSWRQGSRISIELDSARRGKKAEPYPQQQQKKTAKPKKEPKKKQQEKMFAARSQSVCN